MTYGAPGRRRAPRAGECSALGLAIGFPVASAMAGFLAYDWDDDLGARLRREIDEAKGAGYDCFEFNTFDVELFYGENRVKITEAAALGYDDGELTIEKFLSALPDVPPGPASTVPRGASSRHRGLPIRRRAACSFEADAILTAVRPRVLLIAEGVAQTRWRPVGLSGSAPRRRRRSPCGDVRHVVERSVPAVPGKRETGVGVSYPTCRA
jgi:hypothetical protein